MIAAALGAHLLATLALNSVSEGPEGLWTQEHVCDAVLPQSAHVNGSGDAGLTSLVKAVYKSGLPYLIRWATGITHASDNSWNKPACQRLDFIWCKRDVTFTVIHLYDIFKKQVNFFVAYKQRFYFFLWGTGEYKFTRKPLILYDKATPTILVLLTQFVSGFDPDDKRLRDELWNYKYVSRRGLPDVCDVYRNAHVETVFAHFYAFDKSVIHLYPWPLFAPHFVELPLHNDLLRRRRGELLFKDASLSTGIGSQGPSERRYRYSSDSKNNSIMVVNPIYGSNYSLPNFLKISFNLLVVCLGYIMLAWGPGAIFTLRSVRGMFGGVFAVILGSWLIFHGFWNLLH